MAFTYEASDFRSKSRYSRARLSNTLLLIICPLSLVCFFFICPIDKSALQSQQDRESFAAIIPPRSRAVHELNEPYSTPIHLKLVYPTT